MERDRETRERERKRKNREKHEEMKESRGIGKQMKSHLLEILSIGSDSDKRQASKELEGSKLPPVAIESMI